MNCHVFRSDETQLKQLFEKEWMLSLATAPTGIDIARSCECEPARYLTTFGNTLRIEHPIVVYRPAFFLAF